MTPDKEEPSVSCWEYELYSARGDEKKEKKNTWFALLLVVLVPTGE